jgi:CRISPR/Cas system-associated exonuclease Cas4 (RecB family)
MESSGEWLSASDLAEYAYCPRAAWYRRHPPRGVDLTEPARGESYGERFHERTLRADEQRDRSAAGYWALLIVAILLIVGAVWLFFF